MPRGADVPGIAGVRQAHVRPVKALRGLAPRQALVRPRRPAVDRRRALIDDGGKVVTRRVRPRLARSAAERPSGGGSRWCAPVGPLRRGRFGSPWSRSGGRPWCAVRRA
ncbi:MOSC N-terminal beta barrel domain-containing protein [Streptomyces sp. NPDC101237]|uniref:MOSC N-terminal beta barrel domain-containing protein n=1 Tax=Streptomyces sp. NPDC101237 TaxID=3366139 RepID=UPI003810221E